MRYCAQSAVAPAKVWTRNRCPVTINEIEHNVCRRDVAAVFRIVRGGVNVNVNVNNLHCVWTECHVAASVRRRVRARLVPTAEDSYEEREIC